MTGCIRTRSLQGTHERCRVERLGKMLGEPRLEALLHVVGKGIGRHGNDGHTSCIGSLERTDATRGFEAVHYRHHDVEQHGVKLPWGRRLERCQRLGTIRDTQGAHPPR